MSENNVADVYVLNVRGHMGSGNTRGDISYPGQLDDDITDFIVRLRAVEPDALIVLGGHSSGGALAIRYAAGPHGDDVERVLALAPILGHRAPTALETAGGWAHISLPRIIGLSMLNTIGIHQLDDLPTIRFHMPQEYRDGTETLQYSWRLMNNFNLRNDYEADIEAMPDGSLTLVGSKDEAMNVDAFPSLYRDLEKDVEIVDGQNHFSLILDPDVFKHVERWLAGA